ncbi:MAG: ATP-binding cassette domain-containing protein, partial [Acidimicrobiales bacterium]
MPERTDAAAPTAPVTDPEDDVAPKASTATADGAAATEGRVVFDVDDLSVYYGEFKAVRNVTMAIKHHEITAFIGPSGCGKTTLLRCFNRLNDLIAIARVEGRIDYHGVNLYDRDVNPVEVRR